MSQQSVCRQCQRVTPYPQRSPHIIPGKGAPPGGGRGWLCMRPLPPTCCPEFVMPPLPCWAGCSGGVSPIFLVFCRFSAARPTTVLGEEATPPKGYHCILTSPTSFQGLLLPQRSLRNSSLVQGHFPHTLFPSQPPSPLTLMALGAREWDPSPPPPPSQFSFGGLDSSLHPGPSGGRQVAQRVPKGSTRGRTQMEGRKEGGNF